MIRYVKRCLAKSEKQAKISVNRILDGPLYEQKRLKSLFFKEKSTMSDLNRGRFRLFFCLLLPLGASVAAAQQHPAAPVRPVGVNAPVASDKDVASTQEE